MSKSAGSGAFWTHRSTGRGTYREQDELLHPEAVQGQPDATLCETQYFGVTVPEHNVHGLIYLWYHPNLRSVSGGVWAFRDYQPNPLACDLFDWRNHMSDAALSNDLHDYTLDLGLRVRMIEAGRKFHATYHDAAAGNHLDIEYTGVMPPFAFATNKRFEQTMRAKGTLVLRGKPYTVDGHTVRTRSWGQPRAERPEAYPPMTWMSASFGDDFSFCCSAFDHPDLDPDWKDAIAPAPVTSSGGFIFRDGETREVRECRKRVVRDAATLMPMRIELEMIDSESETHRATAEIVAGSTFNQWYNMNIALCLARWQCHGRVGHGDAQDAKWANYIYWNARNAR